MPHEVAYAITRGRTIAPGDRDLHQLWTHLVLHAGDVARSDGLNRKTTIERSALPVRVTDVKKIFTNTMKVAVAATALVAATTVTPAQDRSRDRGAPIIFSSPKTDTISTNLHEVNEKKSPFKNLESEIRKPFEIFDSGPTQPKFKPAQRINNAPQPVNRPGLKAILEKSAEEQFLNGKQGEQEDLNDPFKSPDSTMDPLGKNKSKTALDRYYDRLEKEQGVRTNKSDTLDFFGNKKERTVEEKHALESNRHNAGREQDIYSKTFGQASTNAATENIFSRTGKIPEGGRIGSPSRSGVDRAMLRQETRMENFKKLLDGPAYSQPKNDNFIPKASSYGSTEKVAQRLGYITPTPSFSSKPATTTPLVPGSSFSKSSGIVGTAGRPSGLQEYESSDAAQLSTPVAPVQKPKMKPSTFNPPTRR